MMMLSPIVWEHHPVFIIFPFLIMIKKITTIEKLIIYLLAYILIFLTPTFDFYPFSYLRLLVVVMCYILMISFLKNSDNNSFWFKKINQSLSSMLN